MVVVSMKGALLAAERRGGTTKFVTIVVYETRTLTFGDPYRLVEPAWCA